MENITNNGLTPTMDIPNLGFTCNPLESTKKKPQRIQKKLRSNMRSVFNLS